MHHAATAGFSKHRDIVVIKVTSRHIASLRVVLTLFTLGAARLCATPRPLIPPLWTGRCMQNGRTVGHPDFNIQIDSLRLLVIRLEEQRMVCVISHL